MNKQMKTTRLLILTALFISAITVSNAQNLNNLAFGFKVGEPLGINIRKYFSYGEKALDFNIGTYGFIYGSKRKYGIGSNKGQYKGSGIMFQTIYNWHYNVFKKETVHVYYGLGGQINSRNHYPDDRVGQRDDKERKLSLGPTGNAGLEIDIPNNDLGVFLDVGLYVEALPTPLFVHPQINAGVRLNITK